MGDPDATMWLREATAVQERLRPLVRHTPSFALDKLRTVAGVDAAYRDRPVAAVAVMELLDLRMIGQSTASIATTLPYVPGFLSFREAPVALAALERLRQPADVLLCDGQGYAHPRRFGLACHLGVTLDLPSIGCAKTRLIGTYIEPGPDAGDHSPLLDDGEVIGVVLRTRAGTKPLFISVGHKMDLPTAVAVVMRCVTRYRLPEPIRAADHLANASA